MSRDTFVQLTIHDITHIKAEVRPIARHYYRLSTSEPETPPRYVVGIVFTSADGGQLSLGCHTRNPTAVIEGLQTVDGTDKIGTEVL